MKVPILLKASFLFGVLLFSLPFSKKKSKGKNVTKKSLYIYHNGMKKVVKNYQQFEELKPMLDKNGLKYSQNWVPDDSSSKYRYYQFIDRDSVYVSYSLQFDSVTLANHQNGQRISNNGYELSMVDSNTYLTVNHAVNTNLTIENQYSFEQDSLTIMITYSGAANSIQFLHASKFID